MVFLLTLEWNLTEKTFSCVKGKTNTAQKMKFSIKDFSSKCDQTAVSSSHLLEKFLMQNFIFCAVQLKFCRKVCWKEYPFIFRLFDLILYYVTMKCIKINWSCKHIKKVRSSQAFISINSCTNSVCNFQSMKIPVEMNSLFLKLFCYITWFD